MAPQISTQSLPILGDLFVRLSAILFAWYLFGFLSYFPGIDGLKWSTALFIATICLFCASGLWFTTLKFAAEQRLLKFVFLIPTLIIFPIISYLIDPLLLIVSIGSLIIGIYKVLLKEKMHDRPPQAS